MHCNIKNALGRIGVPQRTLHAYAMYGARFQIRDQEVQEKVEGYTKFLIRIFLSL